MVGAESLKPWDHIVKLFDETLVENHCFWRIRRAQSRWPVTNSWQMKHSPLHFASILSAEDFSGPLKWDHNAWQSADGKSVWSPLMTRSEKHIEPNKRLAFRIDAAAKPRKLATRNGGLVLCTCSTVAADPPMRLASSHHIWRKTRGN